MLSKLEAILNEMDFVTDVEIGDEDKPVAVCLRVPVSGDLEKVTSQLRELIVELRTVKL